MNDEKPNGFNREGWIAFLDILGFKGIWAKKEPAEIVRDMEGIKKEHDRTKQKIKTGALSDIFPDTKEQFKHLDLTIISDTIVIEYSLEKDDNEENEGMSEEKLFAALKYISNEVQSQFLTCLKRKLPLRGAIAFGEYYKKGNIFIGPAVDDAAEWHNQADWLGVILTPKATMRLDSGASTANEEIMDYLKMQWLKYLIPLKDEKLRVEKLEFYALNWVNWVNERVGLDKLDRHKKDKNLDLRSLILKNLYEQGNIDTSTVIKYNNTIRFVDKCLENLEK